MRILIAEDDAETAEFVERGLRELGHNVAVVGDGSDAFSEGNVFVAANGNAVWTSGLTYGSTATGQQAGNGDVFLAHFDAEGVNS